MGLYEQSLAFFDKAIEQTPEDSECYHNKGVSLKNLQRYEEAIIEFDKTLELNPLDQKAYKNKGDIFLSLGEIKKAEEQFRNAKKSAYGIVGIGLRRE